MAFDWSFFPISSRVLVVEYCCLPHFIICSFDLFFPPVKHSFILLLYILALKKSSTSNSVLAHCTIFHYIAHYRLENSSEISLNGRVEFPAKTCCIGSKYKLHWTGRPNIVKYRTVQQPISMRNFAYRPETELSHIMRYVNSTVSTTRKSLLTSDFLVSLQAV